MITFPFINKILVFSIDIIAIWLGFLVYRHNKKGKINKIFIFLVIFMLLWVNCAYLARIINVSGGYNDLSILLLKIAWLVTPLFFAALYLLVINITANKKTKGKTILNKIVISFAIIVSLLTVFPKLTIKDISLVNGGLGIIYGRGIVGFLGFGFFLIILTIYLLLKAYPSLSTKQKIKTQYLFIGLAIFYIANLIFNIFLPVFLKKTSLYYLGDYSTIILLGFIAYAIIKERLFGVKVIFTQLLVGLISILLLINFLDSKTYLEFFWKGGLFVAFLIFGWLLIKSVMKEIKQREELDRLATELATVNVRLEGANKKLQKLDKAKSEFLSIASHQLRTPLTAIKGYISMILEGDYGQVAKEAVQPMRNVFQSNERLIKLVNSLLNISRIDAGKTKFNKANFSLEEMIVSLINEFKIKAKEKKLYLKLEKSQAKIPQINADEQKLRQVFGNLIDNAIKYTPSGGITVRLEPSRAKMKATLSDTGEGLTKSEIEKLFHSFSRAGAGKRFWIEGAGLGLYVAKKFVQMHKGRIWVTSPGKGKGSTFHIELPMR